VRWRITIAVWPHSTGNGGIADKKAAGADDGDRYFYVDAADFGDAVTLAYAYAEGIQSHPAVWKAPVMGVHRYDPFMGVRTIHNPR